MAFSEFGKGQEEEKEKEEKAREAAETGMPD